MKTLIITFLIIVVFLFENTGIYSQSGKGEIYHTDLFSIVYLYGIDSNGANGSINSAYYNRNRINNIYKVIFINDTLIKVSGDLNSNTDIEIGKIDRIVFKKGSVNISAWIGLVTGAIVGGYCAGDATSPGVGRVFSAIGGSLLGGFIGGSILGAMTTPSKKYESYNLGKFNRDKKNELQRIFRKNSSR